MSFCYFHLLEVIVESQVDGERIVEDGSFWVCHLCWDIGYSWAMKMTSS